MTTDPFSWSKGSNALDNQSTFSDIFLYTFWLWIGLGCVTYG
jgi:hypothetical protein